MSYFPNKNGICSTYGSDNLAFGVGPNRDCYSIYTAYHHDLITDVIQYESEVYKNHMYSPMPKDPKPDRKYRELMFTGHLNQCHQWIENVVVEQGYWKQDPNNPFKEVFVEPSIKA